MKSIKSIARSLAPRLALVALLGGPGISSAAGLEPLVDDFSHSDVNSLGIQRQYLSDAMAGGGTTMSPEVTAGILSVSGTITPPRGQPGWASSVLLLQPEGLPRDASAFEGIRLLVKVNQGQISLSANSTEVVNYDYHAAQVVVRSDGRFHEVKVPFASMKRAWSEQTVLNTGTIASISIVAFDVKPGSFDFELDEVAFY